MPGLFLDQIADFAVSNDKMAPSPSSLFLPSVINGGGGAGVHSPYSNNNNAQIFDPQVQQPQQALYAAQDLAAELALKLGFNDYGGGASSLSASFQQQQQQTSLLAAYRNAVGTADSLNSGGESRSSCSETDYAALNEPTAFELLHIAAAAAAQRKSQNTTECVPVPSSEHVAEIVGRQGCKIKALRAKTNTYIKTPVRGEDSIFVVTGRKEDVAAAKQEILSAAEHFTQIRASRRHSQGGIPAPGHITAYVRVPYKFVGLVVGPKGATIKRIQQQTHTYIVTPSRDKEPVFEVTGLSENVESARREIETHIGSRTGQILQPAAFLDTNYNGMIVPNTDFDLNNHHFNQSSPSNSVHSAAASILNDFHMNGTDSSSSCAGVVGLCASNTDSSIISSSYGSQTSSGSSSSSSGSSSSNGQMQQFSGGVGPIICKPAGNCLLSALPTYQHQQCGNSNEDSLSTNGLMSSQVQIGYSAWTSNTVNLNPRTVSSNSDINGYILLNGAKNLHSLLNNNTSNISKSVTLPDTDDNGWSRSSFVNSASSFLNREFLTPDLCNENQQQQSPAPPPPCALLPSFLSSIWSNNDNVDDDLTPNNDGDNRNDHHSITTKFRSASLGDGQFSTTMTMNQNFQAGTSVGLNLVT